MKYIFFCCLMFAANVSRAQDSLKLHIPPFKLTPDPRLKNLTIEPGPKLRRMTVRPGLNVPRGSGFSLDGVVIDSTAGFKVWKLPLDGMICLVPDAHNPAMNAPMIYQPQKAEGALIPNPLLPGKR